MVLLKNVIIDHMMSEKIKSDTLSMIDELKLYLANFAASLFPDEKVYINASQQNSPPPCLFVDFYAISKQRRLNNKSAYEIGFTISYLTKKSLLSTELDNAMLLLQQEVTTIKEYPIQAVNGDVTDGIANVTGIIKLDVERLERQEFINKIEQELRLNDKCDTSGRSC